MIAAERTLQAEQSARLIDACLLVRSDRAEAEELAEQTLRPMALEVLAEMGTPDDAGREELEEVASRCASECAERLALIDDADLRAMVREAAK